MRSVTFAALLTAAIATPAVAGQDQESGLEDTQRIFHVDDAQPMQLTVMSEQEMRETEGAFVPLVSQGSHHITRTIGGESTTPSYPDDL